MKNDALYLEHIIDCIDRINDYTEKDQFVFINSSMVQDAVIRNLQILSESTQKVSESLKQQKKNRVRSILVETGNHPLVCPCQ